MKDYSYVKKKVETGKVNEILKEWFEKYTVHNLNFNYSNSSYHKKDTMVLS